MKLTVAFRNYFSKAQKYHPLPAKKLSLVSEEQQEFREMACVASRLIEEVTAHAQNNSPEYAQEICSDGT